MKLSGRFGALSAIIAVTFLFMFAQSSLAATDDCVQKRKTPQAPADIYNQANPLEATPENILAGEELYTKGAKPLSCVNCHGDKGDGKGRMAMGTMRKPRDFTCQAMMKDIPDGQMFWAIRNGLPGTMMMGFKAFNDEQIWQIVTYLRQFSK